MGANIDQLDLSLGAAQAQNDAMLVRDTDGVEVFQLAVERMQVEMRLEWIRLQVPQYTRDLCAEVRTGSEKPCQVAAEAGGRG